MGLFGDLFIRIVEVLYLANIQHPTANMCLLNYLLIKSLSSYLYNEQIKRTIKDEQV